MTGKETNEELVLKIQAGQDKAGNLEKLYLQNKGLIGSVAARYVGYEDHEDLMQEGFLGLLKAAELWEPDGGASFAGYAFHWIRAAMKNYIDDCGSVVRVPRERAARVVRYSKMLYHFRAQFGRDPNERELVQLFGIKAATLDEIRKDAAALSSRSTDETISEDGAFTLGDTIASEADEIGDAIEQADRESLSRLLWGLVDGLEEAEAAIIRKKYKEGKTTAECVKEMGVTVARAQAAHNRALTKLRQRGRKQLKAYADEILTAHAFFGTGYGAFERTWTSAPERAVILAEERGASARRKYGA